VKEEEKVSSPPHKKKGREKTWTRPFQTPRNQKNSALLKGKRRGRERVERVATGKGASSCPRKRNNHYISEGKKVVP